MIVLKIVSKTQIHFRGAPFKLNYSIINNRITHRHLVSLATSEFFFYMKKAFTLIDREIIS